MVGGCAQRLLPQVWTLAVPSPGSRLTALSQQACRWFGCPALSPARRPGVAVQVVATRWQSAGYGTAGWSSAQRRRPGAYASTGAAGLGVKPQVIDPRLMRRTRMAENRFPSLSYSRGMRNRWAQASPSRCCCPSGVAVRHSPTTVSRRPHKGPGRRRDGRPEMGLEKAFAARRSPVERVPFVPANRAEINVAVQGTGEWVKRAIQEELAALRKDLRRRAPRGRVGSKPPPLKVAYVGIDEKPSLPIRTSYGERYLCVNNPAHLAELDTLAFDLVIIASPDSSHVEDARTWLRRENRPTAIVVEKPLSNERAEAKLLDGDSRRRLGRKIPVLASTTTTGTYRHTSINSTGSTSGFSPFGRSTSA